MNTKVILVAFTFLASIILTACFGPAVKPGYQNQVGAKGSVEIKYTAFGKYGIKSKDIHVNESSFKNVKIWYPADLENATKEYPVVVFANGTGIINSAYEEVFKHLASWGFIAVSNDDKNSWSGKSTSQSLDLLLTENTNRNSIFYRKVNISQIGVSGHSQGGVAVINAITTQHNSSLFSSAFGASTTKHELSLFLKWPYDVSKIKVPYFAVAGTGASDAGDGKDRNSGIAPLWSMKENYNKLSSTIPRVIARRKDAFHEHMLYKADGYMTAWFMYTLTNDNEAKKAFAGSNPELKQNANWQDVEIRNVR